MFIIMVVIRLSVRQHLALFMGVENDMKEWPIFAHRPRPSTQSESDWVYAKGYLANCESPKSLIHPIAYFRQDKANPDRY